MADFVNFFEVAWMGSFFYPLSLYHIHITRPIPESTHFKPEDEDSKYLQNIGSMYILNDYPKLWYREDYSFVYGYNYSYFPDFALSSISRLSWVVL
jgi:hypothetical protein